MARATLKTRWPQHGPVVIAARNHLVDTLGTKPPRVQIADVAVGAHEVEEAKATWITLLARRLSGTVLGEVCAAESSSTRDVGEGAFRRARDDGVRLLVILG